MENTAESIVEIILEAVKQTMLPVGTKLTFEVAKKYILFTATKFIVMGDGKPGKVRYTVWYERKPMKLEVYEDYVPDHPLIKRNYPRRYPIYVEAGITERLVDKINKFADDATRLGKVKGEFVYSKEKQ